jgi:photosystem II stability/assembly factor-like uncharacterized protein
MTRVGVLRIVLLLLAVICTGGAAQLRPQMHIVPAEHVPGAVTARMLSATLAGKRLVAVGDHGVVLLSDDGGRTFRQARFVPVSSALTGVSFADADQGWAVGHWGVVLHTADGGESWTLQRSDLANDQPLFSVYFTSLQEGWAVGLWSIMLHTTDGGAHWNTVQLPPPPGAHKADRNLYRIFANSRGELYIACEQGHVLRSTDSGRTWSYLNTGYTGSFWSGIALPGGVLLVGGLRGTIYRSENDGATWTAAKSTLVSSITDMARLADNSVVAVALDGVSLVSHDDGASFTGSQRADRLPLTAVSVSPQGTAVMFSAQGPIT